MVFFSEFLLRYANLSNVLTFIMLSYQNFKLFRFLTVHKQNRRVLAVLPWGGGGGVGVGKQCDPKVALL